MITGKLDKPPVTASRPIAVMSFNRPHYLQEILYSLRAQTVLIMPDQVFLFQDGYRSKKGEDITDPRLVERCVQLFETAFPKGKMFIASENLVVKI